MATGWQRLPGSGQPYYGTLRPGAEEISAPEVVSDLGQPGKNAGKPVWVAYAHTLGIDTAGLTKAQIVAAVEELVEAGENDTAVGGEVAGVDLPADPEQPGAGPGHQDDGTT